MIKASEKHIAEQFEFKLAARAGKPRYSYSLLELAKCGRKYYYAKSEPRIREETYPMVAGTILDTAFNAYYENNAHLTETHEQRREYARAAIDLLFADNPQWWEMPWSQKAGDVRSSPENYVSWLFDKRALDLVCRHDRGPVEVQKRVELELPNYSIVGYIDCLELDTGTVVDVKSVTGWSDMTEFGYALKSQVPLYRMLLQDTQKIEAKGRYELVLCRKTPKLVVVPDHNIEFLQSELIKDFDNLHRKIAGNIFDKDKSQCMLYNKLCPFFAKCWPELAELVKSKQVETITE